MLGLGSNLGPREANLKRAVNRLTRGAHPVLSDGRLSRVYTSSALLPPGAPAHWDRPYLNAALAGRPLLGPEEILARVKEIETALGRSQAERWAPRTIDIDILFWEGLEIHTEELDIPHPGILHRSFVLEPLRDLAPDATVEGRTVAEHARGVAAEPGPRAAYDAEADYRVRFPELMGILNVTPDSFSDGGLHLDPEVALGHAVAMLDAGAAILDLGAESTRPAGEHVPPEVEWERLEPVLRGLGALKRERPFRISLDSRNPGTVARACEIGIDLINDVTAFSDPAMMGLAGRTDVPLVFMHSLSIPVVKGEFIPRDSDPVQLLEAWGLQRLEAFDRAGIDRTRLIFDPGIGFGKTSQQNWEILERAEELHALETPLLIGHSRKSLFEVVTDKPAGERDPETLQVSDRLADKGVDIIRVHDVALHAAHFRRRHAATRGGGG